LLDVEGLGEPARETHGDGLRDPAREPHGDGLGDPERDPQGEGNGDGRGEPVGLPAPGNARREMAGNPCPKIGTESYSPIGDLLRLLVL